MSGETIIDKEVQKKIFVDPVSGIEILEKSKCCSSTYNKIISMGSQSLLDYWQSKGEEVPPCLVGIDNEQLGYWLLRFIMEARNQQGDEYIGRTIYALCGAIQHCA